MPVLSFFDLIRRLLYAFDINMFFLYNNEESAGSYKICGCPILVFCIGMSEDEATQSLYGMSLRIFC